MITNASQETKNVWNTLLKLDRALVEKDSDTLEQLLTADFIEATPMGIAFTKTAYINHHCKPGFGIMALSEEDFDTSSIRFYDGTAVVNRRAHAQFKLPTGSLLEYDVQRIEILVKKDNEWKMVGGQGTQVVPINQSR